MEQLFIKYLHIIEEDKLYYFMLAHEQENRVLIVKAPSERKERDEFLGYKWSKRKGNEGIQYIGGDTVYDMITPLFDPNNLNNDEKINTAIKRNFIGEITDSLPEHCHYANLTDLLDFSRVDFDKTINLNPTINIELNTQWPLVKLGDEIDTIETGKRPEGGVGNISSGAWSLGGEHIHPTTGRIDLSTPKYVPLDFYHGSTRGILQENDILLCKDGALTGKIALLIDELNNEHAMVNEHVFILRCESQLKQFYIFNFLFSENGQNLLKQSITGSAQGGLNSTNLKEIKIPLPQLEVQQQIVDECEVVDQDTDQARQTITTAKQEIEEKVQSVINAGHQMKKFGEIANTQYGYTAKADYEGNIRYLRITDITEDGQLKNMEKKYINPSEQIIQEFTLNPNDIVIARSGSTGRMLLYKGIDEHLIFASYLVRLKVSEEIMPEYIFAFHKTTAYWQQVDALTTTLTQPNLNAERMKQIRIPVPSLEIQQQLVTEVEQLEAKITEAQAVIDKATERKNAILTKHLQKTEENETPTTTQ